MSWLMRRLHATAGEPFVWLTAMGLTIGLTMVVSLLGLILFHGLATFWPQRVAQLELRAGAKTTLKDAHILGGKLITSQTKTTRGADTQPQTEWQVMVGNRDAYGLSFLYVDAADIVQITYPQHMLLLERLEYGNAFGFPIALQLHGNVTLAADAPTFPERLHALVTEANQRWQAIKRIERTHIGALNAAMDTFRLRQRALERAQPPGTPVPAQQLKPIQDGMAALQGQYDVLAKQAQELRAKQDEDALLYRLPTGEERRLALGNIVHYYFPNQLTIWQRCRMFLSNLWVFLTAEPREANTEGGVFPAIFGTFVMTLLMSIAVTPFGVLAALYLREYAKQGLAVRIVRIAVNNLAGVPSIVFGVFGLGFFVYFVGGSIDRLFFATALPAPTFGTGGVLWAALTLALMTVPVVIVATEEALAAVPRGIREGSLACGASKWQTIQRVILPAAAPGILTGLILAMARGAGEVAPLMLVGVVKLAPTLPLDTLWPFLHLDRKFMHLGFHLYDLGFQSPDADAAKPMVFATTLVLIALIVCLNVGAIWLRDRLRKTYATGAF